MVVVVIGGRVSCRVDVSKRIGRFVVVVVVVSNRIGRLLPVVLSNRCIVVSAGLLVVVKSSSSSSNSELNNSDRLMSFGSFFVTILLYTSLGLFVVNMVVDGSGRNACGVTDDV